MTAYNPAADDIVRRLPPRVVSTRQLLRLEQISRAHGFSQNLDPAWMAGVISDEGRHILTPADLAARDWDLSWLILQCG
jgi:hypothetical protein